MGIVSTLKPRILFFGTPEFAVICLQKLIETNCQIVGVITSPDRPAGRGKKLRSSAVKDYALDNELVLLQPANLKDPVFIKSLEELKADIAVVVAFRMLPKSVWSLPSKGTFNLHASLLPQYRGAAPINWAIANGEKESGVTTFLIDEKIDTGALLLQKKILLNENETAGSLHDKLAVLGSELIVETIECIFSDTIRPELQEDEEFLKDAPKLTKGNTQVSWNQSLEEIQNFVRAMNPYPGAWVQLSENEATIPMKIFEVEIRKEKQAHPQGILRVEDREIQIAHPDGWVICQEIQLPNKRRMQAKALLNGYVFDENCRIKDLGF